MFVTSAKVTLILGSSKNFWRNLYSVVWDFRLLWLPLHPISYKLYPAMQKVFRRYTLCLLAILVLFSCKPERQHRGITDENQRTHVDSVIFDAFDTRDVPRTLAVIDSVERLGELSKVRIDPTLEEQTFEIPLCKRYADGKTYQVGHIHIVIATKDKVIELTPEKASVWTGLKKILIGAIAVVVLILILLYSIVVYRRKLKRRAEDEYRRRSRML